MLLSVTIVLLLLYWLYYQTIGKRKGLPPGPIPLPIVGNLHQLDPSNPITTFLSWNAQYGQIYSVWIPKLAICVCDYRSIKETFEKRGHLFADRPYQFMFEAFIGTAYHQGIASANGPLWREQRLFAQRMLKEFGSGSKHEERIITEVERLVSHLNGLLDESGKAVITPNEVLGVTVGSINSTLMFGHPIQFGDESFQTFIQLLQSFGSNFNDPKTMILDIWPWLRYVPLFKNFGYQTFLDHQKEIRKFFYGELDAHKRQLDLNAEPHDYFDAFLKEQHRRKEAGLDEGNYSDRQLCLSGLDIWGPLLSVTATLCWDFLYMLHFPEVEKKVSEEIGQLGSDHIITLADRSHIPYTISTLNEIQRLANIVMPTNIPHAATEDCTLMGYAIKAGTMVIPAVSNVLMDPMFFPDPKVFQPRRFLEDDGQTIRKIDQHIPFGLGKRKCVGENLTNNELFLIFATLMQKFKFTTLFGHETPSLNANFGVVAVPCSYEVMIEKR